MTTQGMMEDQALEVASPVARASHKRNNKYELAMVTVRVGELAAEFPPYPHDFVGHV